MACAVRSELASLLCSVTVFARAVSSTQSWPELSDGVRGVRRESWPELTEGARGVRRDDGQLVYGGEPPGGEPPEPHYQRRTCH
jgi:hypothetical protein